MLLGRDGELRALDLLLDGPLTGQGGVAVIRGPAGIGKSALLAGFMTRAKERGFAIASARGRQLETEMAFGAARQLLEPTLRAPPYWDGRGRLAGAAGFAARALGLGIGEAPVARADAIRGLYWLCADLSERQPLAVAIDDLQWADGASLAWLAYLAARCVDLAVLTVVTVRDGDTDRERPELTSILSVEGARHLSLRPFGPDVVGCLVREWLDERADDAFCETCWELTGGNPLFVRELASAARQEGLQARSDSVPALRSIAPAAVGVSVTARLSQMGADAVAIARALAVLGDGTEVVTVAELAELNMADAELTADRLASAQILAPTRPLEFAHPLIAAALHEDLARGARRLMHRRAAALRDRDGELARAATHLLASGPARDPWVVEHLRRAARDAAGRGTPEIAASYLRRALAEPPEHDNLAPLLLELGTAEWRAAEPDAVRHLEGALANAHDPATRYGAIDQLVWAYYLAARADAAIELLDDVLQTLAEPDGQLGLTVQASMVAVGGSDSRTAPAARDRAATLHTRLDEIADPPPQLLAALALYTARRDRSATEAERLAELALASEYPPRLDFGTAVLSALMMVERDDLVERVCADLITASRRRGELREPTVVTAYSAWRQYCSGALPEAEGDARAALEHADGLDRWHALRVLLWVLVERDELGEAQCLLDTTPDGPDSAVHHLHYRAARAHVLATQGRLEHALSDILAVAEACEQCGLVMFHAHRSWRGPAALIYAEMGDTQQARRLARDEVSLARRFERPRALGVALRVHGIVSAPGSAVDLLREAVKVLERSHAPVELARARADLGTALRRAGQRLEARNQLAQSLDTAHHCGARRIANRARTELIALGAKPRRDAITGRDALTPAELGVARLAARGITNREIAQALFITTKTASAHLSRIYRKLGITRRGQLPDALAAGVPAPEIAETEAGLVVS